MVEVRMGKGIQKTIFAEMGTTQIYIISPTVFVDVMAGRNGQIPTGVFRIPSLNFYIWALTC